jgi:hypothetical protein
MESSSTPDSLIDSYPDVEELEEHANQVERLELLDVVRDVVRIISVAHMAENGFLNAGCVLTGGMGLRLRGSTRFTRYDTDSSLSGPLEEVELVGHLTLNTDQLVVTPDPGDYWDRRVRLITAQPINFEAFFAAVDPANPPKGTFSFTISQRGLNLKPDWLPLFSPYKGLQFTKEILVPVMHVTEQAAEKAVGWAAHSLAKHYFDLAWLGENHADEIEQPEFYKQAKSKLDIGHAAFPAAYKDLREVEDLFKPLYEPQKWAGPLSREGGMRVSQVHYIGSAMNWAQAVLLVRDKIITNLFPPRKAAHGAAKPM